MNSANWRTRSVPFPTRIASRSSDRAESDRATFPGEVFMKLADALHTAGVERKPGIAYRELLSKHLGEVELRGKEHRRIQYAILTAFAVQGGLEPDLLDEVTYWIEQYWQYALLAAVAIIRKCAEHSGMPLETFVSDLAASSVIDIN